LEAAVEIFGLVPCLIAGMLFAAHSARLLDRYSSRVHLCRRQFGLVFAGWRAWQALIGHALWLCCLCCADCSQGKETAFFILAWNAAFAFWIWNLAEDILLLCGSQSAAGWRAASFLFVSVLLFTWFGSSNWEGAGRGLQAVQLSCTWHGEGHQESFWYYFRL